MKLSRRVFLLGVGATLTTVACGQTPQNSESPGDSSPAADGAANQVLNLYSERHYDTDNALYAAFTEKTGIKVQLIEAKADELIERIKSEGANSPADVLITVDAGRLWRAQEEGLFQPVDSAVLKEAIPDYLREADGHWFGFSKRARVIVYNKDKVQPSELSTYEDLADPKWQGRIIIRSSNNIYNQSLVGSLLAVHGEAKTEEWAKGVVANFARKPQGNDTAQIKDVAAGVGDLALVNTYYLIRLANSDKPEDKAVAEKVGLFFPNQNDRGTHVNISGAGVVKTAKNPEAAIQFLEFLASPDAQEIFASRNYEYPVVAGVPLDPTLAQYSQDFQKEDTLNAAVYGRNNKQALEVMNRAGWE